MPVSDKVRPGHSWLMIQAGGVMLDVSICDGSNAKEMNAYACGQENLTVTVEIDYSSKTANWRIPW